MLTSLLLLLAAGPAADPCLAQYRMRAGHEAELLQMVKPAGLAPESNEPVVIDAISIADAEVHFQLTAPGRPTVLASVHLVPRACAPATARSGPTFAITSEVLSDTPAVRAAVERLTQSALAADSSGAAFSKALEHGASPEALDVQSPRRVGFTFFAVGLLGVAVAAAAFRARRSAGRLPVRFELRVPHAIPSVLQLVIFSYWSLYDPMVREAAPAIAAQVALGYALDALFSFGVRKQWVVGLGPVPIVLSTNLFLWSLPGHPWVNVLALTVAFGSKALLRRGEHHLFNPSALGMAVIGFANLFHHLPYRDLAEQFALAPNMTELILLLALVPQWRLGTQTVSLGAFVALTSLGTLFYSHDLFAGLSPAWPPMFLPLALLISDPATIPRTGPGRFLFGLAYGALAFLGSFAMTMADHTDYFSKVLPLPLLNLARDRFDRWGGRVHGALALLFRHPLDASPRLAILAFVAVVVWRVSNPVMKQSTLMELERTALLHPEVADRHWDREQACAAHPPYCRPFSFWDELRLRRR